MREHQRREEIANSISHGIALVAALAATPFLLSRAISTGQTGYILGSAVFAATMILLYFASSRYHSLPPGSARCRWKVLEHSAIFLLIAGTYTPFTLGVLKGPWGWTLLVLVWAIAGAGVVMKCRRKTLPPFISTGLYLVMGWLVVIAVKPVLALMPLPGVAWLTAGGLAYSFGVIFFALDERLRFGHLVWHLFVMAGTACHFCAVLWYGA